MVIDDARRCWCWSRCGLKWWYQNYSLVHFSSSVQTRVVKGNISTRKRTWHNSWFHFSSYRLFGLMNLVPIYPQQRTSQIANFMGPTWGPPESSPRPQMGPMLAQWTLLSGYILDTKLIGTIQPVIEITYSRQGSILLVHINFRLQYEEVITSLFSTECNYLTKSWLQRRFSWRAAGGRALSMITYRYFMRMWLFNNPMLNKLYRSVDEYWWCLQNHTSTIVMSLLSGWYANCSINMDQWALPWQELPYFLKTVNWIKWKPLAVMCSFYTICLLLVLVVETSCTSWSWSITRFANTSFGQSLCLSYRFPCYWYQANIDQLIFV